MISLGYYSGNSEWERHSSGREIVMAVAGNTPLMLLMDGEQHSMARSPGELIKVPQGYWHRFETSAQLKVTSVTAGPIEHSLEVAGT